MRLDIKRFISFFEHKENEKVTNYKWLKSFCQKHNDILVNYVSESRRTEAKYALRFQYTPSWLALRLIYDCSSIYRLGSYEEYERLTQIFQLEYNAAHSTNERNESLELLNLRLLLDMDGANGYPWFGYMDELGWFERLRRSNLCSMLFF